MDPVKLLSVSSVKNSAPGPDPNLNSNFNPNNLNLNSPDNHQVFYTQQQKSTFLEVWSLWGSLFLAIAGLVVNLFLFFRQSECPVPVQAVCPPQQCECTFIPPKPPS